MLPLQRSIQRLKAIGIDISAPDLVAAINIYREEEIAENRRILGIAADQQTLGGEGPGNRLTSGARNQGEPHQVPLGTGL